MKTKQLLTKWKEVELKDVGKIITGNTPPRNNSENYGNDTPWIKPPNLDKERYVCESGEYLSSVGVQNSRLLPAGSVLVSCIGNIGKSAISGCNLCTNQQINSIIPDENISSEFLYYSIKKNQKRFEAKASHAVVPLLNKTEFSKTKISIPFKDGKPDLQTQKKIVQILEQAEQLKQKREQADKLMDDYLKSVFNEMFLKKRYNQTRLKKLCSLITKGTTPTTYGHPFINEGINFFKIENIGIYGNILMNSIKFISKEANNLLKRSKLIEGDLLFSIAGALGRVAIVKKEHLPANINQAIAIIRLKNKNEINKKYLEFYLRSDIVIKHITENKRGVAQLNLNLEQIGNLNVIIPPLHLQQKFASIVKKVEKIKEAQKKSKQEIDDLFNVLMQKAFRGR